jgi:glutamate dehydrogenase/leucine dehydrogenase
MRENEVTEAEFRFCDDLGPKTVLHLYQPTLGMKAIVVVDNVACGPAIGGTRMAPDVSLEECFRLARAMTLKNAAAGLPHGGAKSVIFGDPSMEPDVKEQWIRAFAQGIKGITDYIPGPDMGTNEAAMAFIRDEGGRSAGLPRELGGIPLDEIGATAFGLMVCADVAKKKVGMEFSGMRIAVQGFGAVGKHAARFFAEKGASIVAAADITGAVYDAGGLDVSALIAHKGADGDMIDFEGGQQIDRDSIIGVDCDLLIPAEAEHMLYERGVLCIPDFIANAGGVICATVEVAGGRKRDAFAAIDEKIRANTAEMLERADRDGMPPREAAVQMARERVDAAMEYTRFD